VHQLSNNNLTRKVVLVFYIKGLIMFRVLIFIFIGFTSASEASLIRQGTDVFAWDTSGNKDWYIASATLDMTYSDILLEMSLGNRFYGWSFAKRVDLYQLYNSLGGNGSYEYYSGLDQYVNRLVADEIISALGRTYGIGIPAFDNHAYTYLLTHENDGFNYANLLNANYSSSGQLTSGFMYGLDGSKWGDNPNVSYFSFALIRDHATEVPEPTTLAIFALGMIGLASRRFKKQS
jgi:hypothetical protein